MLSLTAWLSFHVPADFDQIGPNELNLMTWGVTTTNFPCTVVTSDRKVKWGGGVLLRWWQIMISIRYTTLFKVPELSVKCVNVEWSQYGLWLLTRSQKKKLYWHVLHCTEETMWWSCGAAWYCWERGGQARYKKSLNHCCNTFLAYFSFSKQLEIQNAQWHHWRCHSLMQTDSNSLTTVYHNSERYCVKYLHVVQSRDYMNVSKVRQSKKASYFMYLQCSDTKTNIGESVFFESKCYSSHLIFTLLRWFKQMTCHLFKVGSQQP